MKEAIIELIRIERFKSEKDCTLSKMYIKGQYMGFVIEDEIRKVKVKGETAIPQGTYDLDTRFSPRFSRFFDYDSKSKTLISNDKRTGKHPLIWIKNVPNFEFILIHWGNTDDDSDGCLIVGDKLGVIKGQTAVLNSRIFYRRIYPILIEELLKKDQKCKITITNNF